MFRSINLPLPWEEGCQSIYAFVSAHPAENELPLPDDSIVNTGNELRWAAGAKDGVLTHHMAPSSNLDLADKVLARLRQAVAAPTQGNLEALYTVIRNDNTLEYIDYLIERIGATQELTVAYVDNLYDLTKHIVLHAPDRGAVKCGIAVLAQESPHFCETQFCRSRLAKRFC